jgi:hypothetical protein
MVLLFLRHARQFFLNLIERHTGHTIGAGHPKGKRGQQDNGPRGRGTFLNAETLKAAKSDPNFYFLLRLLLPAFPSSLFNFCFLLSTFCFA